MERIALIADVHGNIPALDADIHFAFQATCGDRLLFNVGSVGNPLDRPLASYAVLEGDYDGRIAAPFGVDIIRVPYDIDRAISRARQFRMPEADLWETELRTARYRGLPPAQPAV